MPDLQQGGFLKRYQQSMSIRTRVRERLQNTITGTNIVHNCFWRVLEGGESIDTSEKNSRIVCMILSGKMVYTLLIWLITSVIATLSNIGKEDLWYACYNLPEFVATTQFVKK